ncbi:MAG: hypothetical protein M0D53_01810 [Flavobacterium sp. JAD_PAG50586_2]|nr:MAG: hypothetical protein M0D53_01810 [Flavobacterium sp. JAD_PAG50586_2]
MKLAGFEWLNDFQIIRIDNEKYITSICYSEKSKFGFVLETIFEAIPDKKNRTVKSLCKESDGYDYGEKILNVNGESKFIKIETLPDNLYLIKQDIYWFQTTENDEINKTLVTKDIAIEILRVDVKNILKLIKKVNAPKSRFSQLPILLEVHVYVAHEVLSLTENKKFRSSQLTRSRGTL